MSDLFKNQTPKSERKVERALFFCKGQRTYLIHEVGANIEADLEGCGGRDSEVGPWTELPKEDGLWVWEGYPGWSSGVNWEGIDEGGDPIYEGRGKARRPTAEELTILTAGPIEKLWGPSHLYPPCTTCGLSMDDRVHDGSPPGCPGPDAAAPNPLDLGCGSVSDDGQCGIHPPGTLGCLNTKEKS